MSVRVVLSSALLALLAVGFAVGCGGNGSAPAPSSSSNVQSVSVQFQISIPDTTSAQARKPAYVSTSTQSASVTVSPGNTTTLITCNTTTRTCSGSVLAPIGSDTFTVKLYDGLSGSGNLLSTGSLTQTIAYQNNTVSVTFNGVVAALTVALNPTSVTVGTSTTVAVTVNALDADGNTIVGPGVYVDASGVALTVNLADSDVSGATHLSQSSLTQPTSGITLSYNGASIANPTISATATGATSGQAALTVNAASPSPSPSPSPTPTASPSSVGSLACTAPAANAGTFTSIDTSGVVAGNTYTEQSGDWEVIAYSSPSPSPSPSPTPTPGSTATPAPTPTPTVAPTSTSTPVMVTEYYGEYTVPSFNGNIIGGGLYTAAATNGCFFMILEQPNAFGDGEPNESGLEAETVVDEGSITNLTITNLTPTSGSGTFSFTNSAANTVSGTITITGSQTFVDTPASIRRLRALSRALGTH